MTRRIGKVETMAEPGLAWWMLVPALTDREIEERAAATAGRAPEGRPAAA